MHPKNEWCYDLKFKKTDFYNLSGCSVNMSDSTWKSYGASSQGNITDSVETLWLMNHTLMMISMESCSTDDNENHSDKYHSSTEDVKFTGELKLQYFVAKAGPTHS